MYTKSFVERAEAVINEAAAKQREKFERSMLEAWGFETERLSREDVSAQYDEEYSARCEGYSPGDGLHTYRELSSEDYESIDGQEGVEQGIGLALDALRSLLDPDEPTDVEIYGAGAR